MIEDSQVNLQASNIFDLIRKGNNFEKMDSIPESAEVDFIAWRYGVISHLSLFDDFFSDIITQMKNDQLKLNYYDKHFIRKIIAALMSANRILFDQPITVNKQNIAEGSVQPKEKALNELMNILTKFSQVVRQLRDRHNGRATFTIEDEYDVQDLLHALLTIHFDDIRKEEPTPSFANCSSRCDFLLFDEQIFIEVKKTRDNLCDKEISKQLIEDISIYSRHPSCKTLVCFVYDPDERLKNPIGLKNDLEKKSTNDLLIIVKVER